MCNEKNPVRIDRYFITNYVSFAMITLFYTIFGEIGLFSSITPQHILLFFAMTTAVMFLMMLTDKMPTSNNTILMILQILDILVVTLGTNCLLLLIGHKPLFQFTFQNILLIIVFNLIVYFSVYGVNIMKYRKDQNQINEKLRLNRELSEKENQHE